MHFIFSLLFLGIIWALIRSSERRNGDRELSRRQRHQLERCLNPPLIKAHGATGRHDAYSEWYKTNFGDGWHSSKLQSL